MLKIGNTVLRYGIILAPMAGVADYAFRRICMEHGAEFAVSEMVSAKAICYGDKKTPELAALTDKDTPAAVQLFGHDPENMAEAARRIASGELCPGGVLPSSIDINCGCPVPKIVSGGDGSAMMKNPEIIGEVVSAVKFAVGSVSDIPVTVKLRAGWDAAHINAVSAAKIAEEAGAALITVHGRTREQMYMGKSDRAVISAVKRAVAVPVIGNGDIYSADDAFSMLSETGCDGVMVARGALGNPFIFDETLCCFDGREFSPPTLEDVLECAERHLGYIISEKGEHTGILQARKHLSWYIKGVRGSARFRDMINRAESFDDVKRLLCGILSDGKEGKNSDG